MNVKKTKEIIIYYSKQPFIQSSLLTNGGLAEIFNEYNYLSTVIDVQFCLNKNLDAVY